MTTETRQEAFRPGTTDAELDNHARGGRFLSQWPGSGRAPWRPQMMANGAEPVLLFSQQRGHLWLRHEWEYFQPLAVGVPYAVNLQVKDIYPRRDRTILLTETEITDPDGRLVSRQRHHQSFLLDNPPTGEVQFRDPRTKEGASRAATPVTRELASLERTVSLEMCGEFFHGSRNYRSDREQSAELGFRDVVVGGRIRAWATWANCWTRHSATHGRQAGDSS